MPASSIQAVSTDSTQYFNSLDGRPPAEGHCGEHTFKHDAGNGRVRHLSQVWPKPVSPASAWSPQEGGAARALYRNGDPDPIAVRPSDPDFGRHGDDDRPRPLPRVKSLRRPGQQAAEATSGADNTPSARASHHGDPVSPAGWRPETPPGDPDPHSATDTSLGQAPGGESPHEPSGTDESGYGRYRYDRPRLAASHPDVVAAHGALRTRLLEAAPQEARSMRKAAQPTGSKLLRRLMAFMRRRHDQPLQAHGMAFYKHLVWHAGGRSTGKQVSAALAALAQRATAEGYQAVVDQFVGQTLNPQLHGLSTKTLAQLAQLKHKDNQTRGKILAKADQLLGVKIGRQTGKSVKAGKQAEVAAALLDLVAELCGEHYRIKTWDRPMASLLSAAEQGQYEQLDEALRQIWSGDLRMGDMNRARSGRLQVERLGKEQLHKLASTLGLMGATKESMAFEIFEQAYLPGYEPDKAIRDQLIKLLTHLRVQTRRVLADAGGSRQLSGAPPFTEDEFQAAGYPAVRPATFAHRLRNRIRKSFRTPAAQVNAERRIKQAALALAHGNSPTEEQLTALATAYRKLDQALGQSGASALLRKLVQDRAAKMTDIELSGLDVHLAKAIAALPDEDEWDDLAPSEQEEARLRRRFYDDLRRAQRKEPGIRSGSEALKRVLAALPERRRPEKLLDALDAVAAASCRILDDQDELDFYRSAFLRLDGKKRKALHKYLNGRHGIDRHAQAIGKAMAIAPKAWSDFRRHQLGMLASAAAATA